MPKTGLEPVRDFSRQILSLLCLPFHHSGLFHSRQGLWWALRDSNPRPIGYEPTALTN